jgi:hypothetical protein
LRFLAFALLFVLATGCGERPRSVHIEDARALYDGTHGDAVGSLLARGREVASCTRPWLLPEVVCTVDADVRFATTLDLELALDIGTVSHSVDLLTFPAGRHLVLLNGEGAILVATVTFEVRIEPFLPWQAAVTLAILVALGAAFALHLIFGKRLLSDDDRKPRGIAITCARITTAIGLTSALPISGYSHHGIVPLLVAIPTLLGTFAAAMIVIDAIGNHRLGGHRGGFLVNAVFTAAALPLIMVFWTLSLKAKAIMIGVMMILLLFG